MTEPGPAAGPRPGLRPDQVVAVQLGALAGGDVAGVWRYASPENRAAVGPIERFTALLHDRRYRPLLGHSSAVLGALTVEGETARLEVLVSGDDGAVASYTFVLSRQSAGAHPGCWMTDGVLRHEG